jgi:hypothetical protein
MCNVLAMESKVANLNDWMKTFFFSFGYKIFNGCNNQCWAGINF